MADSGNIGNKDAKTAELPKPVHDAIAVAVYKGVRRAISGLESKIEAKRPRTVVEKHFNMAPGAFEESIRIHAMLVEENKRAERLLLQLRQARAELAVAASAFPKG